MAERIIMPKAGMSMETGTIIRWLKNEGDTIELQEPVLEIETDKLTMEVESDFAGVLLKRLYEEGAVVPIVTTIAWIGKPGETIPETNGMESYANTILGTTAVSETSSVPEAASSSDSLTANTNNNGKIAATPAAKRLAKERGIDLASLTPTGSSGEIRQADVDAVRATPLACRQAITEGISLSNVPGSGPDGKIYQRDLCLKKTIASTSAPGAISPFKPYLPKHSPAVTERIQGVRKIIADRMLETHLTVPAATLRIEIDADPLWQLRSGLNRVHGTKITFNDLVLKAAAMGLAEFPELNAFLQDGNAVYNEQVHLGVAMAVERGLLVPVIHNAENRSLFNISDTVKELTARAKFNKLKPDELTGGTFTVTNLGMYGILSFTPIINLPQVAILGVCAIVETPVIRHGMIVPGRRMGLCLTHDHRWIDGALGASFLLRIREFLENPLSLL